MEQQISTKGYLSFASPTYEGTRQLLAGELRRSPIPDVELGDNLGLYMERMYLSRILIFNDLYRQIVNVPGCVVELGVRWGNVLSLFNAFRGMYEPYNYARRVIGFDTFDGFAGVSSKDGASANGDLHTVVDWKTRLEELLAAHETMSPIAHIQKWELVKGDATKTFSRYLDTHPDVIVALAHFDFDIYTPTKACLKALIPRLTKGSVVIFDELNCAHYPGETEAVREVLGLHNIRLLKDPNNIFLSWFVWE